MNLNSTVNVTRCIFSGNGFKNFSGFVLVDLIYEFIDGSFKGKDGIFFVICLNLDMSFKMASNLSAFCPIEYDEYV